MRDRGGGGGGGEFFGEGSEGFFIIFIHFSFFVNVIK